MKQPPATQIPIAITGLGLVCPLGNSVPAALARARCGDSGIRSYASPWVDALYEHLRVRVGGTVAGFEPARLMEPKLAVRHEPAVLYALAAADEALAQSGLLDADDRDRDRIGCVIGA